MSPCLYGHHTEFAYSRCGRTTDLYKNKKLDSYIYIKISFNNTQDTVCRIYFLSHVISRCEVTVKYYSEIINGEILLEKAVCH